MSGHVVRTASLAFSFVLAVYGQFNSSIQGTVLDASQASVPGATIRVTNKTTGVMREVKTTDEGFYRVLSLSPGSYQVISEKAGFLLARRDDIELGISENIRIDFTMTVGAVSSEVTVADRPPLVETEQGRVSGRVDTLTLKEMPLNGRNVYNLIALQPGVTGRGLSVTQGVSGPGNDSFAGESNPQIYASGQRAEANNFTLDDTSTNGVARGGITNLTPSVESIQEVRVVANNFSAEDGRNTGAQVQVISKSGTNQFHGGVSYYFQNNTLSSRNLFETAVPVFRKNQFAYSIGGPIFKNRTFFHHSYEGLRQSGSARTQVLTVETPQLIDLVQRTRPNSIAARIFRNNPIAAMPNSNFRDVGSPVPGVNVIGPNDGIPDLGSALFAAGQERTGNQFSGRIDHELRPGKDRLYGNFYLTKSYTMTGLIRPSLNRPTDESTKFLNINWTHTFSPTRLNEFRAGVMRLVGIPWAPAFPEVPSISITGMGAGVGRGIFPAGWFQTNYHYKNVFTNIFSRHTLKLGGELRPMQANAYNTSNLIPAYTFANILDFIDDEPIQMVRNVNPATGDPVDNTGAMRVKEFALFINDDWKISRSFTLSLGLRYEYYGSVSDATNIMRNMLLGEGSTIEQRIANGVAKVVPGLFPEDTNNFAPRFGFAWDVGGKSKTVVRGGYGIAYDRMFTVVPGNYRQAPPLRAQATLGLFFGSTFTYTLGDPTKPYLGFPVDPALRLGLDERGGIRGSRVQMPTAVFQGVRSPYVHNWFFGVQRDLGGGLVVEANYMGTAGRKLLNYANVNRYTGDLLDGRFNGFNPSFSQINWVESSSLSNYHGGTFQVKRPFKGGLVLQGAFTFGKVTTDADDFVNVASYQDVWNRNADRSLASFDVSRKLVIVGVYDLPRLTSQPAWMRHTLGGWQLAGNSLMESGMPFTVVNNGAYPRGDYNADNAGSDRPNAPGSNVLRNGWTRQQFLTGVFAVTDFPAPALGTNGNLGRNTFRGPAFFHIDMSLAKNFRFAEKLNTQLRLDMFNALNRVNLRQPVSDLNNINFGRSTDTFTPRAFQAGLRVYF